MSCDHDIDLYAQVSRYQAYFTAILAQAQWKIDRNIDPQYELDLLDNLKKHGAFGEGLPPGFTD